MTTAAMTTATVTTAAVKTGSVTTPTVRATAGRHRFRAEPYGPPAEAYLPGPWPVNVPT